MNKKRKLCQEYNTSIQTIKKLRSIIKNIETELVMNKEYPYEFIWKFVINKRYKNIDDRMILYHEPHKDTLLDDVIETNDIFTINTMYYDDDGVRWFKLSDGRGWIIK